MLSEKDPGNSPGKFGATAVRSVTAGRPDESTTPVRLAFLDNLRVALTVLVVAHHVALAYGNLGIWPNWQQPPSAVAVLPLDVFVVLNQTYFMGFFFLLSGLLVPRSADRRGAGRFARERIRRLGIPLFAGLILIRPLYTLPRYLDQPANEREPYWTFFLTHWNLGPLWFLEALLVFGLCYALLRRLRPPPTEVAPTSLRGWQVWMFAAGLGVALYLWRIIVPIGTYLLGIPSASHLPQYVALFAVGALAFRRGWLTRLPRRAGLLGAGLLVASLPPMGFGGDVLLSDQAPGSLPQLGFAMWEALFGIGAILVLIVLFQRHITSDGPLAQFLARNAFAVYLVHGPVVVGVVALLQPTDLPHLVKFAIALPVSMLLSWLLAALLRRLPRVRDVL